MCLGHKEKKQALFRAAGRAFFWWGEDEGGKDWEGVCVSRQAAVMGWTVEGAGRGFVFRQAGRGKAILEGTERKKRFSSGGGGFGEVGKVRG